MVSEKKELQEKAARALMSLIRITEALEDGSCIISPRGSVAARLLPEIFSVSAAEAMQDGCDETAVKKAVTALTDIRDDEKLDELLQYVFSEAELFISEEEGPVCLQILAEFDRKILEKDRDFYIKRGGADIALSDMYRETVRAIKTIMLKG